MAKYHGKIGFVYETEGHYSDSGVSKTDGIWNKNVVERFYYGDILRNTRKYVLRDAVNEDVDVSNEISIVADSFAMANFHLIQYAEYLGAKWRVANISIQYPRMTLSLGGLYHG